MLATDTVVLIRPHKKAYLLEMKVDRMKDRKVYANKISFDLGALVDV